ncbi:unnamed protein product [Blumeria hordei]|uniref:C2H2-type domain-containing protein n=1 Tax=Blumeria hordei TaxID=2867405 RepID=A0A383UX36_BLUHO|nr:unnamed protein product [Blumeria hordei]
MPDLGVIRCPFCGFECTTEYQILYHFEVTHPEDSSNNCVQHHVNTAEEFYQDETSDKFECCPVDSFRDVMLLPEQDDQKNLNLTKQIPDPHQARFKLREDFESAHDKNTPPYLHEWKENDVKQKNNDSSAHKLGMKMNLSEFLTTSSKFTERTPRFGSSSSKKAQIFDNSGLGPHANEDKMPAWLFNLISNKDGIVKTVNRIENGRSIKLEICPNIVPGVIPILAQMFAKDESTKIAYLCHPEVKQISKLKKEVVPHKLILLGGFCGYRNIQMMASYIIASNSQGHEIFNGKIPSIFEIQEYIEDAWDLGINPQGRVETGGIRGTRKYIGTSEVQAMFCRLGIASEVLEIRNRMPPELAFKQLLSMAQKYFSSCVVDVDSKIYNTSLPPIYLQHQGHSMTIIGYEERKDGSNNLLVFDPKFSDSQDMIMGIGSTIDNSHLLHTLKFYRKGANYLGKYNEFEIFKLANVALS